eukprot:Unigene5935_Nuclearia_a/m.18162 Unigene5935_Nuclearia_a/g.18162  ORF Unigene5935_Nuclearia_a/g.18162 Unigene5935_Nuclearia_a/m.18162 type:complete len:313 (-) Unigene5935_Nuclearia_a:1895-2833(-)
MYVRRNSASTVGSTKAPVHVICLRIRPRMRSSCAWRETGLNRSADSAATVQRLRAGCAGVPWVFLDARRALGATIGDSGTIRLWLDELDRLGLPSTGDRAAAAAAGGVAIRAGLPAAVGDVGVLGAADDPDRSVDASGSSEADDTAAARGDSIVGTDVDVLASSDADAATLRAASLRLRWRRASPSSLSVSVLLRAEPTDVLRGSPSRSVSLDPVPALTTLVRGRLLDTLRPSSDRASVVTAPSKATACLASALPVPLPSSACSRTGDSDSGDSVRMNHPLRCALTPLIGGADGADGAGSGADPVDGGVRAA